PLVIFIDTNLPMRAAQGLYEFQATSPPMPSRIMIALLERVRAEHGGVDSYAMLVFTNHPHHYALAREVDPQKNLFSVISGVPMLPHVHHDALVSLHGAANLYGNVLNEFPTREW